MFPCQIFLIEKTQKDSIDFWWKMTLRRLFIILVGLKMTWKNAYFQCIKYRMSHRYWANFSTSYFKLETIFLSPDWNPTTHMTWQTSTTSNISPKMKHRSFLKRFAKMFKKKFKIHTWEPGAILGNLDLNKTLLGDPFSGTWTRTWEPGPVYVYVRCNKLWILDNWNKF